MNVLLLVFLFVCTESRRRNDNEGFVKGVDVIENGGSSVPFGQESQVGMKSSQNDGHTDPLSDLPPLPRQRSAPSASRDFNEGFVNPRDEYMYNKANNIAPKENQDNYEGKGPMWLDFPALQEKNIEAHHRKKKTRKPVKPDPVIVNFNKDTSKSKHFRKHSLDLLENIEGIKINKKNWTTCEQFGKGASFHPIDIVDIDWVPFYLWTSTKDKTSIRHRFSLPTIKQVSEYKDRYGQYLDSQVDWDEPKLILKTVTESLLIAADRTGLYNMIQKADLSFNPSYNVVVPVLKIRLKIEDPYLVMMFCDEDILSASVMAVAGQEPLTDAEKIEEASTVDFHSDGLGRPVTRNVNLERIFALQESAKPEQKYLRAYRDYGLFPPKDVEEKHIANYRMPEV